MIEGCWHLWKGHHWTLNPMFYLLWCTQGRTHPRRRALLPPWMILHPPCRHLPPDGPSGAHGTYSLAPTERLCQLLYPTPHLAQCAWCFASRLRMTLPLPGTVISRPPSRHPFACQYQRRSRNPLSFTYDGDNTNSYTPSCIIRNLLNIIPIHDSVHYHLLTLLYCTIIAATTTPAGSSSAHDTCLSLYHDTYYNKNFDFNQKCGSISNSNTTTFTTFWKILIS